MKLWMVLTVMVIVTGCSISVSRSTSLSKESQSLTSRVRAFPVYLELQDALRLTIGYLDEVTCTAEPEENNPARLVRRKITGMQLGYSKREGPIALIGYASHLFIWPAEDRVYVIDYNDADPMKTEFRSYRWNKQTEKFPNALYEELK